MNRAVDYKQLAANDAPERECSTEELARMALRNRKTAASERAGSDGGRGEPLSDDRR